MAEKQRRPPDRVGEGAARDTAELTELILRHPDIVRGPDGRGEVKAWCPWHPDREGGNPSLTINVEKAVVKCFRCDQGGLRNLARAWDIDVFATSPENRRTAAQVRLGSTEPEDAQALHMSSAGLTLNAYAAAKRLPSELLRDMGVGESSYQGVPRLIINYQTLDDSEGPVRYRSALVGENRFRWRSGSKPVLYGLTAANLQRARSKGVMHVVEGESDVHTLIHRGRAAVGIPGSSFTASTLNAAAAAGAFDDIETLAVHIEPDGGGETVLAQIEQFTLRQRVKLLRLDGFKDVSELHIEEAEQFDERLEVALNNAESWLEAKRNETLKDVEEAWEQSQELANSTDILALFRDAVTRHAIAGDTRNAAVVFLALVSRRLQRPVSLALKGPSSAGKSFLVEKVLDFFPDTAWFALTAMSERALAYLDEPLQHRIIVIFEGAGLERSGTAAYMMRSLLSEGRLAYMTVEKTDQGLRPRRIEQEGPTGLITTTTRVTLDRETETRLFSLNLQDSQLQTAAVMKRLAAGNQDPVQFDAWHSLQVWLDHQHGEVTIPFAGTLADLVPPVAVRLRRDFGALLQLVRASAFLHQHSRKRDDKGQIEACVCDYEMVRDLIADTFAEGVGTSIPETVRETAEAVKALTTESSTHTSVRAVAERLRLDRSAAQRRVAHALELNYIKDVAPKQGSGRPKQLMPDAELPPPAGLLPTVVELNAVCACGRRVQQAPKLELNTTCAPVQPDSARSPNQSTVLDDIDEDVAEALRALERESEAAGGDAA